MVKSAERVMRILDMVRAYRDGLTQKEISDMLQIPKSSLFAILDNMTTREYLTHNNDNKRFVLGPQVLILAGAYLDNQDVIGIGRPLTTELSRKTGETGALAIPVGYDALIVYKEDSSQPILPSIQVGTRLPLFASAVGKAILSHYSEREIDQYFKTIELAPLSKFTVTDPLQLIEELKAIRNGSPAYNRQGYREGITAIAAPVFNHQNRVVASISVSSLSERLTRKKEKLFEDIIIRITQRFSRLLGYSPR
jgi:IclR family transcriptional regulator, KDG regulon repressor